MNTNRSSRLPLLKSILLFMGASFFAFLLSVALHETGHYLASIILGVPERGIVLNHFGQNYNIYLGDLDVALGTTGRHAFGGASGMLFDLFITLTVSLLLWRKRSPALLPLLLLGSYALLHESVSMIMEVIEYPNACDGCWSDWVSVMRFGVPPGVVALLAAVMLAAGCIWLLQLLPLTGITAQDAFWRRLVVLMTGIPLLFLCAVIYQTLFGVDYYVPAWRGWLLMESVRKSKIIYTAASAGLTAIITPLHRPLFPWLDRLSHTPAAQVRWRDVLVAIGLAVVIIAVQWVLFNDPTIKVR